MKNYILLREAKVVFSLGQYDLVLDTTKSVTLSSNNNISSVPRKTLFTRSPLNHIIHHSPSPSTGTIECYLTKGFKEAILFTLLGMDVSSTSATLPDSVPTNPLTGFIKIMSKNTTIILGNVVVTGLSFGMQKGFAGDISINFEGVPLEAIPVRESVITNTQEAHLLPGPLTMKVADQLISPVSAMVSIQQNVEWLRGDTVMFKALPKPIITGMSFGMTTTHYYSGTPLDSEFGNVNVSQCGIGVQIQNASITRRLNVEDILQYSCDIQPTDFSPIITFNL